MKSYSATILILFLLLSCSEKNMNSRAPQSNLDTLQTQSLTYEQCQGMHLYSKYCSVCHGTEGKGDGFNAFNLDPKPRNFTDKQYMSALTDARLLETITQGGRGVNKSVLMPSWSGRLSNIERSYVAAYIRHFAK